MKNILIMENNMDIFTKPAIIKLARRAGIKNISDDCIKQIRSLIALKINEILNMTIIINNQHSHKTIMFEDLYQALKILNINCATQENMNII